MPTAPTALDASRSSAEIRADVPRHALPARRRGRGLLLLLVLVLGGALGLHLFGFRLLRAGAEPLEWREARAAYADLLDAYVEADRVDYRGMVEEVDTLRQVVATFAAVGPEATPRLFPRRADRLAYYIDAYNALVLFAVLESYPIQSVRDVHGVVEPKPGFGFFYATLFVLDGGLTNLYALENDTIRAFGDARIHGAINCASESCPRLLDVPYVGDRLPSQLAAAAGRLASEEEHVRIDHERRRVLLSPLYDWYRQDFVSDAGQLGEDPSPLGWIRHYAREEVRREVETAKERGYSIELGDYDWSLNERER